MKRWIAGLSATFVMALSGLVPETADAQRANVRVYCGSIDGNPATIIDNDRGRQTAIILWVERYFASTSYSAKVRCENVSKNFAQAIEEGSLRYLVSSRLNGYPVICASRVKEGVCDRLLFTLNFGVDPSTVLKHLNNANSSRNSEPLDLSAIFSSGNPSVIHFDAQTARAEVYCGAIDGNPATIIDNGRGRQVPIILWVERYFASTGYSAKMRCEKVSKNFAQAIEEGSLRYLVSSTLNGYPVICASRVKEGVCDRLLFTLNFGVDPNAVLEHLDKVNSNRHSEPLDLSAIVSSGNRSVINFIEWSSVLTGENNEQLSFTCNTVNKIPTTTVKIGNRDIPIIIWKSENLTNSGLTAEKDCEVVSSRFENLRQKNTLNYITSGVINDLPAICAVKTENEPCTGSISIWH